MLFFNNSLYLKLANSCIYKAWIKLSNPCSSDNQRTEGDAWLSKLRRGLALAHSEDILSVAPGENLTNSNKPDLVQVGGLVHFHMSFKIYPSNKRSRHSSSQDVIINLVCLSCQTDSMLWRRARLSSQALIDGPTPRAAPRSGRLLSPLPMYRLIK